MTETIDRIEETPVKNGIKMRFIYGVDDQGRRFKKTQEIRVYRVFKKYDQKGKTERQQENYFTKKGEEVQLQYAWDAWNKKEDPAKIANVKCRHCQGDHWSIKCPFREEVTIDTKKPKYVPPRRREERRENSDKNTVYISNLEDSITKRDITDLFSQVGRIYRIFYKEGCFAKVTYSSKFVAEKAIEKFNGYGLNHVIIRVEFAR